MINSSETYYTDRSKHEGISTVSIKNKRICLTLVLAVVTETSVKNLGLAGSSRQLS